MQKILGNHPWGQLVVLSGPAGSGKTTLVKKLLEEFPCVEKSISYTTRSIRDGEVEGKDYHFITEDEFQEKIGCDEFLEHVYLFGHFYGTCKKDINNRLSQGKHVILVIDTQGAINLFEKEQTISIFISPPSLEELHRRLCLRKTENEEKILERLEQAQEELARAVLYDYKIINDDFTVAYDVLKAILIAEEHRKETLNKYLKKH